MSYAKIHSFIVRSSICEEAVEVRWLWVVLLSQANRHGQVYGTTQALSRLANLPLDATLSALEVLMQPDPTSTSKEEDGRRVVNIAQNLWQIVNYVQYSELRNPEDEREATRLRVQRHREKKRMEASGVLPFDDASPIVEGDVTVCNGPTLPVTESNPLYALALTPTLGETTTAMDGETLPVEETLQETKGPAPRPGDGVVEVGVRNGSHTTGWVKQEWLDQLAEEYPTVDPLEVAKVLARKVRTGAYTPAPSSRGLRKCLANWCEAEQRRGGGRSRASPGNGGRKPGKYADLWKPDGQPFDAEAGDYDPAIFDFKKGEGDGGGG